MKSNIYILGFLLLMACHKDNTGLGSLKITPDSGPVGNLVTITGTGFDPDISQDSVTFNGVPALIAGVSSGQLQALVPAGATTGPVEVFVDGRRVVGPVYTLSSVSISSVSPGAGLAGDSITITGLGLSNAGPQSTNAGLPAVRFNGKQATVVSATPTSIVALVPNKADAGPVTVTIGGQTATGPIFNYLGIDTLHPATGNVGTIITLMGGFSPTAAQDTVTLNGVQAIVDSASPTRMVVTVVKGSGTGTVVLHAGGRLILGSVFTFVPPPTVTSTDPTSGPAGAQITIAGKNFSSVPGENAVTFNGRTGTVVSAAPNQLVVTVPAGATSGPLTVSVNNQVAGGPSFAVQSLGILSLSPSYLVPPIQDTIRGTGFGTTPLVQFNGLTATVLSAVDTEIIVQVPAGAVSGQATVKVGSLSASIPFSTQAVYILAGGNYGLADGPGAQAQFRNPGGLAVDASGNVFVADNNANNIREISPTGNVVNFAGDPNGGSGYTDAQGASAQFNYPIDLAIDKAGNLYVADNGNSVVRKITPAGVVSTFTTLPTGDAPGGVALDPSGNIYVTDNGYGSGNIYEYNASGTLLNTLNIPNVQQLYGVAVDGAGNIFSCDVRADVIYKGTQVIAGNFQTNGYLFGICIDNAGNLIVAGARNCQAYSLSAASGFLQKTILTGGQGVVGVSGFQGGPLSSALFGALSSVKVDAYGILYVTDDYNEAVTKVSLQ